MWGIDVGLLPYERIKKAILIMAFAILSVFSIFAVSKYVLPVVMPFVAAMLVSSMLGRPILFAERKMKMPRGAAAVIIVILFFSAALAIILGVFVVFLRQGKALIARVCDDIGAVSLAISNIIAEIGEIFSKFGFEYDGALPRLFNEALKNAALQLTSLMTGFAARRATAIPSSLLFLIVLMISTVYFCADGGRIRSLMLKMLPKRSVGFLTTLKKEFDVAVKKYLISYLLIFFLTFGELFLGFTLIGVRYALLLSVITAIIDILPVFGTGTVIIPLAIARALLGDTKTCIYLILMYAFITIVRQIVEPRIVGDGIGLHPAAALFSMYVGLKLLGILGMISFPIAFAIVKNTIVSYKSEAR